MPIKQLENGKRVVLLSYSAFSTYLQCPQRYYKEKVLRIKTREDDLSYNVPGLIAHKATEIYLKTGDTRVFDPKVIGEAVIKHSKEPQVDLEAAYGSIDKATSFTQQCSENLYKFVLSRDIRNKKYLSEQWFGSWDEPLMLSPTLGTQGAPDLIEINPNNTGLLYDYKATWSTKNLNKDQLILYCIAAKLKFGIDIAMCSFFLLPCNKHEYFRFDDRVKEDLIARMQDAADKILSLGENLPYTPSEKCTRCPYYATCPEKDNFVPKSYDVPKGNFTGFDIVNL